MVHQKAADKELLLSPGILHDTDPTKLHSFSLIPERESDFLMAVGE